MSDRRCPTVVGGLRWGRMLSTVMVAGFVAVFGAASLHAQATPRVAGRVTLTRIGPGNLCAQEEVEGARLAQLPEGFALLRMRSELDAASRLETVRPVTAAHTRQLARVRREVDSLAEVLEALVLAAPRREIARSEFEARRTMTARVRQLAPQVDAVVESALLRVAGTPSAAPGGYLGVTMSSVPLRTSLQSGYIVSYCDYPVVEAVDPGSPAERGGLVAGDTILAFNGRDVRSGMVDYTALLEPNAALRVRVRRDGRTRDATVRVEARPTPVPVRVYARTLVGQATPMPDGVTTVRAPQSPEPPRALEPLRGGAVRGSVVGVATVAPEPPGFPGGNVFVFERAETLARTEAVRTEAVRATAPAVMSAIFANADDAMLGGAQLKTLSDELRAALSLPAGVLVLQVLRGTPAGEGGMREGDVIVSVNGTAVRRVDDVRGAFVQAQVRRALEFRVVRNDAAERTVTMKW
jgi:S1-C subfamily serine protease